MPSACANCGGSLDGRRRDALYCTDHCRFESWAREHPQRLSTASTASRHPLGTLLTAIQRRTRCPSLRTSRGHRGPDPRQGRACPTRSDFPNWGGPPRRAVGGDASEQPRSPVRTNAGARPVSRPVPRSGRSGKRAPSQTQAQTARPAVRFKPGCCSGTPGATFPDVHSRVSPQGEAERDKAEAKRRAWQSTTWAGPSPINVEAYRSRPERQHFDPGSPRRAVLPAGVEGSGGVYRGHHEAREFWAEFGRASTSFASRSKAPAQSVPLCWSLRRFRAERTAGSPWIRRGGRYLRCATACASKPRHSSITGRPSKPPGCRSSCFGREAARRLSSPPRPVE